MNVNPWRTSRRTWWSEADLAEIDIVAWDLVDAMKTHEEHCDICRQGYRCDKISDALEATIAWRDRRLLLTKAQTLRAEVGI